jgi:hypothetical protein
LRTI